MSDRLPKWARTAHRDIQAVRGVGLDVLAILLGVREREQAAALAAQSDYAHQTDLSPRLWGYPIIESEAPTACVVLTKSAGVGVHTENGRNRLIGELHMRECPKCGQRFVSE